MKIKVVAYTGPDEEGQHAPGEILDMREGTAREWIKRGWAIARPDLEEKPKEQQVETREAKVERAVIETPEDRMPEHEQATLKRKKK